MIYIRGDDGTLQERANKINYKSKWTRENMVRRLKNFNDDNDLSLFEAANTRSDLGHPKAKPQKYPMTRFFQEHKTEVFELETTGNEFEMFEDMRVYVERNGRPYNYLPTVDKLNQEREQNLVKEETDRNEKHSKEHAQKQSIKKTEREELEKLQQKRLIQIRQHMNELEDAKSLNMRQFLMKQIIPVLTEGMIDVYRVSPTDPVDYLAEYIFKKSNEMKK